MTKILKLDPKNPDIKKIRIAAAAIKRGGIVIFPTETVYGIGANALDEVASKKIFEIKGRPSDNPLMIHVLNLEMAQKIGIFPKRYHKTIRSLWPGPIAYVVDSTGLLNRKEVAIRAPDSKIAMALIRESGTPIAAPSANISKKPSSTNASHTKKYFNGKVDVIIDGGPSENGIESTILDLRTFTLLRPGAFSVEMITKKFGKRPKIPSSARGTKEAKIAIAPGMKYRHYSPNTALFLYSGSTKYLPEITKKIGKKFAFIGSSESCRLMRGRCSVVFDLGSRSDKKEIAKNLFDSLIRLDEKKVDFAIVEGFSEEGIGLGIMNRLRKASQNKNFKNRKELDKLLEFGE